LYRPFGRKASRGGAGEHRERARVELRRQGTQVIGVHVGFVDTDLTAPLEVEKIPPATVAASALDALQAGEPEALVDDFSRAVKSGLSDDQRALYSQVEREFLAMAR
jgi:NAD(P)-dependent dehydrogenase (short-subunit alcohol dehydrogenase family)